MSAFVIPATEAQANVPDSFDQFAKSLQTRYELPAFATLAALLLTSGDFVGQQARVTADTNSNKGTYEWDGTTWWVTGTIDRTWLADYPASNLRVGQMMRVSGHTTASVNGLYRWNGATWKVFDHLGAWQSLTVTGLGTTNMTAQYTVRSGIVYFELLATSASVASGLSVDPVVTIPSDYRPAYQQALGAYGGALYPIQAWVSPSPGTVAIRNTHTATITTVVLSGSWPVA